MAKKIWNYPGVFIAWGLSNGELDAEKLVATASAVRNQYVPNGYKWFALEVPSTPEIVFALRSACHRHSCFFGIWEVQPTNLFQLHQTKPNFYIANVESPYNTTFLTNFRGAYPLLPAGVVTNFGGIDTPALAKPWIDRKFDCLPEAYVNANPQATPPAMVFEAIRRGWAATNVFPVFGAYDGYPLSNYMTYVPALPGWSVYLAEGIQSGFGEQPWGSSPTTLLAAP